MSTAINVPVRADASDLGYRVCRSDCTAGRPTLVIGIFSDRSGATRAVHDLHLSAARCFRQLSSPGLGDSEPGSTSAADDDLYQFLRHVLTIDEAGIPAVASSPTAGDSAVERRRASLRVYGQVTAGLKSGDAVILVHAHGSSQQFTASRILLQSACDVLLTHDGSPAMTQFNNPQTSEGGLL